MKRPIATILMLSLVSCSVFAVIQQDSEPSAKGITKAAQAFLATLDDKQKAQCTFKYDDKKRVDWHFIPKAERKGLQYKNMNEAQRKAAMALLSSTLSKTGFEKAKQIMALEGVLAEFEKGRKGGPVRDTERYYYSIFGEPKSDGKWGLSIEGHHMSLNFVVQGDKVVSSSPFFLAANPATVMNKTETVEKGVRVLKNEEALAFKLVQSLDDGQKKIAVLSDTAPKEIRAAGAAQPPTEKAAGINYDALNDEQKDTLRKLVVSYLSHLPTDVRQQKVQAILADGAGSVHFAWAGAQEPGVGHYYRVQAPSFLIEFVNTQPDPKGNKANHIHCVLRDMRGDFALSIK